MATKITCDNCGGDDAARLLLHIARSGSNLKDGEIPVCDADLCRPCSLRVARIVGAAFPQRDQSR